MPNMVKGPSRSGRLPPAFWMCLDWRVTHVTQISVSMALRVAGKAASPTQGTWGERVGSEPWAWHILSAAPLGSLQDGRAPWHVSRGLRG